MIRKVILSHIPHLRCGMPLRRGRAKDLTILRCVEACLIKSYNLFNKSYSFNGKLYYYLDEQWKLYDLIKRGLYRGNRIGF